MNKYVQTVSAGRYPQCLVFNVGRRIAPKLIIALLDRARVDEIAASVSRIAGVFLLSRKRAYF
jgi:hypothetical protein